MPRIEIEMETSGPIFDRRGADIAPIINRNMGAAVQELVEKSEQELDKLARPRPGGVYLSKSQAASGKGWSNYSTGNYRRNIFGTVSGLRGKVTDGGVIYGPWLEKGRQGTRFRGYAMFRRTRQWAEKQAPEIARKHIQRLITRMNR